MINKQRTVHFDLIKALKEEKESHIRNLLIEYLNRSTSVFEPVILPRYYWKVEKVKKENISYKVQFNFQLKAYYYSSYRDTNYNDIQIYIHSRIFPITEEILTNLFECCSYLNQLTHNIIKSYKQLSQNQLHSQALLFYESLKEKTDFNTILQTIDLTSEAKPTVHPISLVGEDIEGTFSNSELAHSGIVIDENSKEFSYKIVPRGIEEVLEWNKGESILIHFPIGYKINNIVPYPTKDWNRNELSLIYPKNCSISLFYPYDFDYGFAPENETIIKIIHSFNPIHVLDLNQKTINELKRLREEAEKLKDCFNQCYLAGLKDSEKEVMKLFNKLIYE